MKNENKGIKMFYEINNIKIPLISTGTSPFIGAGQFGKNALIWRKKFLENEQEILKILKAGYEEGARGIEVIPIGKILEAAKIMRETYKDYIITGSTYPGHDNGIKKLLAIETKIIFVHGIISDKRDNKLIKLIDEISSLGIIPGVATHDPIKTIIHVSNNLPDVKLFLVPFNAIGRFMGDKSKLEKIVDDLKDKIFIAMKSLAAGKIEPLKAFNYIKNHNIAALTIGMVSEEQARESTKLALKALTTKQ
ncbi:MAG: hypothetical protein ACTSSM_03480 [Promethearchaeota archaeon]